MHNQVPQRDSFKKVPHFMSIFPLQTALLLHQEIGEGEEEEELEEGGSRIGKNLLHGMTFFDPNCYLSTIYV
jgi:hypothetical protein